MHQVIHLNPSDPVAKIALAAGHGYRGRKIKAVITDGRQSFELAWSGGSKDSPIALQLDGMNARPIPDDGAPWDPMNRAMYRGLEMSPGIAVVNHSHFCGKDMGITIYIHPDNAAGLLPKTEDLPEIDRQILYEFQSLKSSYRRRWADEHLDRLASLGYLKRSRNGATRITTEGKNAAAANPPAKRRY